VTRSRVAGNLASIMSLRTLATLAVLLAAAPARADRAIVIESYSGSRPERMGALLQPVLEELRAQGYDVGYDGVGRMFEREVSRASRSPSGLPGDIDTSLTKGHDAWIGGSIDEAVTILAPLIDAAHDNSAAVSQNSALRARLHTAMVELALAHARRGDAGAAGEIMGELLRAYPTTPVTKAKHGPEAFALYEDTRKALGGNGRGTLVVDVVDPSTQIFVDEEFQRTGDVNLPNLYPGKYRVYAAHGQREGRTYQVEVRANETAEITVDIGLDAVVHVDAAWTGLEFAPDDDRAAWEGKYAKRFAELAKATSVAVLGVETIDDKSFLVGTVYAMTDGAIVRQGRAALEPPPSTEKRRALARYVAGDDSASESLDNAREGPPKPKVKSRWGILKWLALGVGVGAAGVSAYLWRQDGTCTTDVPVSQCPRLYNTSTSKWASAGGAALFLGLGIYMFITDTPSPPKEAMAIVPVEGGAMATAWWQF
jgi:hypothetical protein